MNTGFIQLFSTLVLMALVTVTAFSAFGATLPGLN